MSLEDIFISVVDKSEEGRTGRTGSQNRITRRSRGNREKGSLEKNLGASLYEEAQRQRELSAQNDLADDNDD